MRAPEALECHAPAVNSYMLKVVALDITSYQDFPE
jgi:hypothetical protein